MEYPEDFLPNGMEQHMRTLVRQFALAAAIPVCLAGQTTAQDAAPEQPVPVEQAPVPEAQYPSDGGADLIYAEPVPAVPGAEVVPALPAPGCDPLIPPPVFGIHPQPMYCPQPVHGVVPFGCPTSPLYPTSGLCCLNPIQATTGYCPPPITPASPWCPPTPVGLPIATTPIPPLPAYTGVVAGYPFSTAPVYSNSCATRHQVHPLRKDALWHVSPGNMFPQPPITPIAKGNYYFRPYNFRQVQVDQMHAALWTGNTAEPYTSPLLPELSAKLHHYKASLDKALLPSLGSSQTAAPGTLAPLVLPAP